MLKIETKQPNNNHIKQPMIYFIDNICDANYGFHKIPNKVYAKAFNKFLVTYKEGNELQLQKCEIDKTDKLNDRQIIHFRLNKSFRVHGYKIGLNFYIVRIDPNHKYHM